MAVCRLFLIIFLASAAYPCAGQKRVVAAGEATSLDVELLREVYSREQAVWSTGFGLADRTALPVLYVAVPVLAISRAIEGERRYGDAWQAALSIAVGVGLSTAIKHVVRRERPFVSVSGISPRREYVGARQIDRFSFPSSHATMASALAVSLALSHPKWYVIAPVSLWAAAVGTSRVWLGVHYPSDVIAGWVLGATVAWTVHVLQDRLTPDGLNGPAAQPEIASFSVRF